MRHNDVPEPRLEPPEDKVFGYCSHCKGEIYSDQYIYNGELLCEYCYNDAYDISTVIDFIDAFPTDFVKYLRDAIEYDAVLEVLKDYREYKQQEFDDWAVS